LKRRCAPPEKRRQSLRLWSRLENAIESRALDRRANAERFTLATTDSVLIDFGD
jgi:hypothetical protein